MSSACAQAAVGVHVPSTLSTSEVHLLPVRIQHSGPAEVSTYFVPEAVPEGVYEPACVLEVNCVDTEEVPRAFKASFRGRILKGRRLAVPDGYSGVVLRQPITAVAGDKATVASKFHSFIYWNREANTTDTDAVAQWMKWPAIGELIHAPIASAKRGLGDIVQDTTEPEQEDGHRSKRQKVSDDAQNLQHL